MAVPKLRFKGFISDWDSRKFSDTLSFLGTNSFSRDNMNLVSGSVKNIHYGDILVIYGNVLDTSCEQIPFVNEDVNISKIKEKDYLLSGDVIIADTAEDYTVGKATEIINSKGIKIIAGLHTQACRPKRKFAVGYLGNFVNSLAFRKQIRRIAQGTKVLSIIKKYIEDMEIHFPIEKEQQKISDFLTTFDKRIIAQQNIVADLEETKKGLLQKIFSQEIRFKDDNGQDYPDWEEIVLGKCIKFYNGDRSDKYPKSSEIRNNGIPFINAGDLVDGKVSENKLQYISEKKYKSLGGAKLEVGDIIYCLRGSIGKNALYDKKYGTLASSLVALRCEKGINNSFLYQIINSEVFVHKIRIYSTGLAQPNLAASDLKKMKLCIPKRNEQDKIAKFLSSFDKKITAEKQILSDLQEMKKGLLQQMFV